MKLGRPNHFQPGVDFFDGSLHASESKTHVTIYTYMETNKLPTLLLLRAENLKEHVFLVLPAN